MPVAKRNLLRPILISVLVILLLVAALGICGYSLLFRPITISHDELVRILPETSTSHVAERLQERGIIRNAFSFKLYAHITGKANALKVGDYLVKPGMRPVDILDLVISGKVELFSLTTIPGRWVSEIPPLITKRWPNAAMNFVELASDNTRWKEKVAFPLEGETLEGYLYPDTYMFGQEADAEIIIASMLKRFEETCYAEYQNNPPSDGRSLYQVLILASMVEAEAQAPEERPIIAGVYLNRLHASPPNPRSMDCDATLLYALQERHPRVLFRHKSVDSPYNTYHNIGLPPGPINNPELSSFRAALHPEKVPYFYYVAREDGSGGHYFARTLSEQNSNINRAHRNRRS